MLQITFNKVDVVIAKRKIGIVPISKVVPISSS